MEKEKMERLYVVCTGDTYTIYYRPTYQYITSCDNKDIKSILKKLLAYSTEDFYSLLIDKKIRLPSATISLGKKDDSKDHEEWYLQAWKCQTDSLFSKLKLKMIYEDVPHEFINDKLNSMRSKSWGISDKPKKKVIKRVVKEEPNKPSKQDTKHTNVNTLKKKEKPTKKELRRISKSNKKKKKKLNKK